MNQIKIFPSLISSNILNLEKTVIELGPFCDGFHIDIMDNHFVPNLTWGPPIVNQIAARTDKPLSVHLMVEKPETIINQLRLKEKSSISIHIENENIDKLIRLIQEKKQRASIAIKPETPLEKLYPFLKTIEQVLLMSVEPGFSGQKFLPNSIQRLKELIAYRKTNDLTFEIAMDGGINEHNIHQLFLEGCTSFCIASAIFSSSHAINAIKDLYTKALEG